MSLPLPIDLLLIITLALVFDFTNGFHDAANSIATVVSTRVLSPRWAVVWAAFFNFVAFAGVRRARGEDDRQGHGGSRGGDARHRARRAARGAGVEPAHVVVGAADVVVARADRRVRRRRGGLGGVRAPWSWAGF
jgi:hypothetical protein